MRVGHAVDAHQLAPGRALVLGGVEIPFDRGLEGHSDGDVLLHLDGRELSGTTTGDPGRISVTVTDITGQEGRILMVLGQNNAGSLCAMIDADAWALPTPGALRELPGGDGGPCGEGTPETSFPAGDTRVTAAVVIPGNPSPEATIDIVVPVDGDVVVTIDGSELSG